VIALSGRIGRSAIYIVVRDFGSRNNKMTAAFKARRMSGRALNRWIV